MKLTNENIKAAMNRMKLELIFAKSCRAISDPNNEVDEGVAMFEIALAALDACRWRDAETEPPENSEDVYAVTLVDYGDHKFVVCGMAYLSGGEWYVKIKHTAPNAKVLAWLPLPEWEASDGR